MREAHNELLDAMMQSYRNLIRFARRNNLSVSASPQDIGVLTRKLYAAFEALPGKVTLVNPQISPDLSEEHLTFIHVPAGRANRPGWYLYNQAPSMDAIVSHQPLEYNRYLNKLVSWAYFNGLLTSKTHLHIKSANLCDTVKLQELVTDISHHFPLRLAAPTPKALYSPCEIRHLAIIVNLEHDPTTTFRNQVVHFDFRKLDVFSFGEQQQCLVGSIDLLYRNSWNEVRTLHFSGEQAVLEALKTILGKMHQDAAPPESVDVFCYSQHLRGLIRTRIQQLVSECIDLRLSSTRQEPGRFKAVRVSGQTWGLFFERLSVSVQKLENAVEFTVRFPITNCTGYRFRSKPTKFICRQWLMVLPAKGLFSSFSKALPMKKASIFISWMKQTGLRFITIARAVKKSWCGMSAGSIRLLTIALLMAPALSTLTCRSSTKLCS